MLNKSIIRVEQPDIILDDDQEQEENCDIGENENEPMETSNSGENGTGNFYHFFILWRERKKTFRFRKKK